MCLEIQIWDEISVGAFYPAERASIFLDCSETQGSKIMLPSSNGMWPEMALWLKIDI